MPVISITQRKMRIKTIATAAAFPLPVASKISPPKIAPTAPLPKYDPS